MSLGIGLALRYEMVTHDIKLYRGDDHTLDIGVLNDDGTPVSLAGAKVELGFSDGVGEVSYANIMINGNVITAHFAHQTTKNLDYSKGFWDLQITQNGVVTTIAKGKISMTRDITP